VFLPSHVFVHFWNQEVIKGVWSRKTFLLLFSFESFKAYPSTLPSPHEVFTHFPTFPPTFRSATTEHGSLKLTNISYRLRFSFVSFACIVRSFFTFRSFALCSFVSCIVRFVRQFDYTNARNEIRTNDTRIERTNDTRNERTLHQITWHL
jgi:hypothetical protein